MPSCKACDHEALDDINKRLVKGESQRGIARRYNLDDSVIWRHNKEHLPATLVSEHAVFSHESLTKEVEYIRGVIKSQLEDALRSRDIIHIHHMVQDALKQIEVEAKIGGQISTASVTNNLTVNVFDNVLTLNFVSDLLADDPVKMAKLIAFKQEHEHDTRERLPSIQARSKCVGN